jgi:CheY-like chemotaxis protein
MIRMHDTAPLVLVVDDQAAILEFVADLLQMSGYAVLTCEDGRAALALLQAHPVRLVISDIAMPRMDGWQLLQAVRADPHWRTLPVVLMSAAHQAPRADALDTSTRFLAKPFHIDELLNLIGPLLAGAGAHGE